MTRRWQEYNDTISLSRRDMPDIIGKYRQSDCRYFMQLNLQGRGAWVNFKEPIESSIDQLYALYYKVQVDDGFIYICLALWRERPKFESIQMALMSANNELDPMINIRDMNYFMSGDTRVIELKRPTYKSKDRVLDAFFDNEVKL